MEKSWKSLPADYDDNGRPMSYRELISGLISIMIEWKLIHYNVVLLGENLGDESVRSRELPLIKRLEKFDLEPYIKYDGQRDTLIDLLTEFRSLADVKEACDGAQRIIENIRF